jgi:hypothetical protein
VDATSRGVDQCPAQAREEFPSNHDTVKKFRLVLTPIDPGLTISAETSIPSPTVPKSKFTRSDTLAKCRNKSARRSLATISPTLSSTKFEGLRYPHAIRGVTGRSQLTPFQQPSNPALNTMSTCCTSYAPISAEVPDTRRYGDPR